MRALVHPVAGGRREAAASHGIPASTDDFIIGDTGRDGQFSLSELKKWGVK